MNQAPNVNILDVRKETEYMDGHVENAENVPLDFINDGMMNLDKNKTYYVHCGSGYRSMIFASILKARGYDELVDVKGGFQAIKNSSRMKITDDGVPTKL